MSRPRPHWLSSPLHFNPTLLTTRPARCQRLTLHHYILSCPFSPASPCQPHWYIHSLISIDLPESKPFSGFTCFPDMGGKEGWVKKAVISSQGASSPPPSMLYILSFCQTCHGELLTLHQPSHRVSPPQTRSCQVPWRKHPPYGRCHHKHKAPLLLGLLRSRLLPSCSCSPLGTSRRSRTLHALHHWVHWGVRSDDDPPWSLLSPPLSSPPLGSEEEAFLLVRVEGNPPSLSRMLTLPQFLWYMVP